MDGWNLYIDPFPIWTTHFIILYLVRMAQYASSEIRFTLLAIRYVIFHIFWKLWSLNFISSFVSFYLFLVLFLSLIIYSDQISFHYKDLISKDDQDGDELNEEEIVVFILNILYQRYHKWYKNMIKLW